LTPVIEFADQLLFAFDPGLTVDAYIWLILSTDSLFDMRLHGTPNQSCLSLLILSLQLLDNSLKHVILFLCISQQLL